MRDSDGCAGGNPMTDTAVQVVGGEVEIAVGLSAVMAVGDRAVNPLEERACAHAAFIAETEVASLVDDDGMLAGRRVQVRLQCAECGAAVRFDSASVIMSADAGKVAVSFDVTE